jgi:RecG-like helicase
VPVPASADENAGGQAGGGPDRNAGGPAGRTPEGQAAGSTEVTPIGSLRGPGKATVEGRVITMAIRPVERNSVLACEIADETGTLTALFYGRKQIPGVDCGGRLRLHGTVGMRAGMPVMINPTYELLR